MCHGSKTSKTIRFKTENPRHKDAIPYKRGEKHKGKYTEEYR